MKRTVTFRCYRMEKGIINRTIVCEKYMVPSEKNEEEFEEVYIPEGDADGIRTLMTQGARFNGTEEVKLQMNTSDFYRMARAFVN